MTQFNWRKSTYSGPNSDDCVEVADLPVAGKAVRDSKNPNGLILTFTATEWATFVHSIKTGELD